MTEQPSSGGTNQNTAGGSIDAKVENKGATVIGNTATGYIPVDEELVTTNKDQVAYETHRKLLSEKKRLAEEHAKLRSEHERLVAEREHAERKKLEEQGEYKKLLELERNKAKQLEDQVSLVKQQERDAKKLDAFLKAIDGNIESKYWGHINLEDIAVDPDTKKVDEMSVAKQVEYFRANYPEIINVPGKSVGLPSNAPKGSATLSYEEWRSLPAKEMRARYNEILQNRRKE